jgi:hypothetical protein
MLFGGIQLSTMAILGNSTTSDKFSDYSYHTEQVNLNGSTLITRWDI